MKGPTKKSIRFYALVFTMLLSQAASASDPQGQNYASFTLSGVDEGEREGVAVVDFTTFSRGALFDIKLMDSMVESEQTYRLLLRSESRDGRASLAPGTYPIVLKADAEQGYAGGFTATYTQILENRGSYYANVALEYSMTRGRQSTLGGELVIESVEDGYLVGRFELMLYQKGSINKAEPREEKAISLSNGRFKAALPDEISS